MAGMVPYVILEGARPMTSQSEQEDVDGLQDQLNAYMERKGLRSTAQRRLVSDTFFRAPGHLSIDDMLALVRKRDPKVGYATVYRTLKLLVECGLANERQFEDTVTRFEVAHHDSHHDHLICLGCKRIVEFEDRQIERLQETVATRFGFELVSHKHELYGLCETCSKTRL
jgi:Fur family transcriptional regulator, ferric uptake regulator